MKSIIRLAFNIDNSYVAYAATTLLSVFDNLKDKNIEIDTFIFSRKLSKKNKQDFLNFFSHFKNSSINFIDIPYNLVPDFKGRGYISSAAFFRIFLPYLLDFEKVLYLDSDLLVKSDVSEIWRLSSNTPIVAVKLFDTRASSYYKKTYHIVTTQKGFFNSGVLLMNLKQMRRYVRKEILIEFINENAEKMIACDQDVLNFFFYDKWRSIPVQFNVDSGTFWIKNYSFCNYSKSEFLKAKFLPKIVHFTGADKPWRIGCFHPQKGVYRQYLKMVPFDNKIKMNFPYFIKSCTKRFLYKIFDVFPDNLYRSIYNRYL